MTATKRLKAFLFNNLKLNSNSKTFRNNHQASTAPKMNFDCLKTPACQLGIEFTSPFLVSLSSIVACKLIHSFNSARRNHEGQNSSSIDNGKWKLVIINYCSREGDDADVSLLLSFSRASQMIYWGKMTSKLQCSCSRRNGKWKEQTKDFIA